MPWAMRVCCASRQNWDIITFRWYRTKPVRSTLSSMQNRYGNWESRTMPEPSFRSAKLLCSFQQQTHHRIQTLKSLTSWEKYRHTCLPEKLKKHISVIFQEKSCSQGPRGLLRQVNYHQLLTILTPIAYNCASTHWKKQNKNKKNNKKWWTRNTCIVSYLS